MQRGNWRQRPQSRGKRKGFTEMPLQGGEELEPGPGRREMDQNQEAGQIRGPITGLPESGV